jgi:hypothetical protein
MLTLGSFLFSRILMNIGGIELLFNSGMTPNRARLAAK